LVKILAIDAISISPIPADLNKEKERKYKKNTKSWKECGTRVEKVFRE